MQKIECKLCKCIVEKCSLRLHLKTKKCNRLKETLNDTDIKNDNENDIKNENEK